MSSIKCTKCGHKVPSTSWMELKTDCQPKCDNDFPRKSQGPASVDPEKTTCKHCGRNVKESKMSRHLEVCYEVRAPCPYCDENVARKDMKAHTEKCMRKFEEAHEASDAAAAASGNSKKSKTSMTLEAKGTSAETTSHTEQELQLCSGWSMDVSAWLPYATAGNWYAAYVAMEEQFKDTGTDQAARHAHFVPKLVALKQDHFVRDFIDAPYEPQPFDCLIAALFVRACLPFNVWAQRSKVTWQDVLKYLPTVLHSRLSEGAKLYLQEHLVIFEDNGYHMVDEVATDAANAFIPGHTLLVTSSDPVTTETKALDAPEGDMRDVAGAQKQELGRPQVFGKEEERQHSKKSRKYGLVASEQESSTTFHNTSPSDRLGRSEDEPMNYLAATKARSHSTAGMEPCRMTCSEAFKESIPTPGTSGAFNDDPDDDQESCHLKSGSYEVNEACSYKTRSSICEGKPAYYAVAEESNINPRSFAGHLAGGVPSSHQPNQSFCFETTKEDSKPNYFTGSPVSGSFRYPEVPPTLLNAQHEQNEIIQADVPGSSNTKYEMSRGISSQSSRIEYFRKKGGCVKTHDQTQLELSEGTNERQCDETERTVSELGSDLVSPKQKSYTAFQNATPSHHSGPSADEPVKYLATGKASSHSTGGKELHRMTCAEALKESNPTPTATAACIHHRDDGHESCHRIRGSYEVSESYAYNKGRSNICEDKPAHSLVSEDRKICSNAIAGHIGGGALLCRQPNKGFSTETT
ncbi:uncharacterized protein [Dermacentor albipictus]|uniref:uncharacterized protein isoform X2 n=1 Tax=Dermacentor albipictus TaxID=60249 RepID=UPI0038FCA764